MRIPRFALGLMVLAFAAAPVWAGDDAGLARLAICKDSWLDWSKSDPAQLKKFGEHFRAGFSRNGNDPFFVPKANTSIMGLRVVQVFPDSVGMGVGFSLVVDASFDRTRAILEKTLGNKLGKCDTSDGMRTCELDIAEQRTVTLLAQDGAKTNKTLVGCYYYYEK